MVVRLVLDGTLQSQTHFTSNFSVKVSGISFTDPDVGIGDKFVISANAPDSGGKSALVRKIISEGLASVPHIDAVSRTVPPKSDEIPKGAATQTIAYLGEMSRRTGPSPTDLGDMSVYAVEFESRQRLCGLHKRDDGVLDYFICV